MSDATANLAALLEDNIQRRDFFWLRPGYTSPIENWNELAKENAIHAAISAIDELAEQKKGRESLEMLRKELNDGIILDVGCGYGRIAKYLLPERKFDGYVGLDSSLEMLKIFNSRHCSRAQEATTPLVLVNSDIDSIPLKDNSVNNVIVSAVFLHNHKSVTKESIAEIHRVLKPGGKLFVLGSFPNGRSLAGLQGAIYLGYLKLRKNEQKNGPVRHFSQTEVRSLLGQFAGVEILPAGFSVLPSTVLVLPKFLNSLYRKYVYKPIDKFFGSLLRGRARSLFCTHYDVEVRK